MARALFLFNHDAAHQVAHLAPVAGAMAREHADVETVAAYAGESIRRRIEDLIEAEDVARIRWVSLDLPPLIRAATSFLDRILPASRLARLRVHDDLFESCNAIISTERTCLRVKERLGPGRAPLFIRVPHGTGDRSVTFHPDHRKFDLSLVAGPKMAAQLVSNGVDQERIEVTGYSKFERIDLTARPRFFENDHPTFVYNPHFDPYLSSWYDMGPQLLEWFASEQGQAYNLIFAPHVMLFRKTMHVSPEYKLAKRRPDVPKAALSAQNVLVDVDGPRLFDMSYLLGADAYLGDASSQLYEFLVRPRAVFLLDPNRALSEQGTDILPFLATGPTASGVEDAVKLLADWKSTAAEFKAIQEELIAQTFALSDIPASTRAANAIANAIRQKAT